MISDLQLASAITGMVRVVGWSQDAVLGEIAQNPAIDQRAVDAAIDDALAVDSEDPPILSAADAAVARPPEGEGRDRMRALTRRAKDASDRAGHSEQLRTAVGAARDIAEPVTSAAADLVRGDLYPGHEQWTSLELSQRADW